MNKNIETYLNFQTSSERVNFLKNQSDQFSFSISFAEDVLTLNLPVEERILVLNNTNSSNKIALEEFLLSGISTWEQNISTLALRRWAQSTDHLLWHRLLSHSDNKITSQRIQYTILDQCVPLSGIELLQNFTNRTNSNESSTAFQALILTRATQWNIQNEHLSSISKSILSEFKHSPWPENKAIPSALCWLSRFEPQYILNFKKSFYLPDHWTDLLNFYSFSITNFLDFMLKLDNLIKSPKELSFPKLLENWPPLWLRHHLSANQIAFMVSNLSKVNYTDYHYNYENIWTLFAGCKSAHLEESFSKLYTEKEYLNALSYFKSLINQTDANIVQKSVDYLAKTQSPEIFLAQLPMALRLEITKNQSSNQTYKKIDEEQKNFLNKNFKIDHFKDYPHESNNIKEYQDTHDVIQRKKYFDLVYRNISTTMQKNQDYWSTLINNHLSAKIDTLNHQTALARKEPKIWQLCHIQTLGAFKGQDEAILKSLDYTRSSELHEVSLVIDSLLQINTSRSRQELVAFITRPNVDIDLQLKICRSLINSDLSNLQSEIRSALNDIRSRINLTNEHYELIDAISALIIPLSTTDVKEDSTIFTNNAPQDLDKLLCEKIPNYDNLSSEVKRALRTAQFFHNQIQAVQTTTVIDLSPVIDMQYKALELFFRENFEEVCSILINEGLLQRKLDIIGYARPIPQAMDDFERYLSTLPVVDKIPYFSVFKLRKMLRAICQFRPGKRFTLDGVKAFALFFLCFGRSQCKYGLGNLINLGFLRDEDLALYCKELHVFQDFRNRAAHEGFHPEAHNDIDGIWRSTSAIIQRSFLIQQSFNKKTIAHDSGRKYKNAS